MEDQPGKGCADFLQLKERRRTVIAYMVGASNLGNNGFADLKEMKKADSTGEAAIVTQFSRGAKRRPTKRYYLSRFATLAKAAV